MCGLTGFISSEQSKNLNQYLSRMTSRLIHRGPNDEGLWVEGHVGLGHRRLSIVDLSSAGAQPMLSNCGRFVLAYNGEIYNHLELRSLLLESGVNAKWRGHSDTETLLAAISHWGIKEALKRSKGMFALALWDKKKKNLSLARDRMGEKPLYWGWAGKDLIFGSELKALRAHPKCSSSICNEALSLYLRFKYIPSPRSIHPNIYKLEPGTILTVHDKPPMSPPKKPIRPDENYGNLSISRYWDLSLQIEAGARDQFHDEFEAISSLSRVLKKAVNKQMISDVPLGAFLSGGVDSSTIVALMQTQSSRPIKTFTIGFENPSFDESNHANEVAKHLGTSHTKLLVTDNEARDIIPDLPSFYDEPFADSSQIPMHLVCRAARQGVTVALSGDGGDELFGGYNRYIHGPKFWKRISFLPSSMRVLLGVIAQKIPLQTWDRFGFLYNNFRKGSSGISNLGVKVNRLGERLRLIKSIDDLYLNMSSNWIEPSKLFMKPVNEPNSQLDDPLPDFGLDDPAMRMMFQDLRSYLPDDILCKVDRAAMAISLETRAPFLDPDVFDLSARLPVNMKIRNGHGKWALRQVLYNYVPHNIIDRPKSGFTIPIGFWLRGPLRDWAEDLLSQESLSNHGLLNNVIIRKTWKDHSLGYKDWTNPLWSILMFQEWHRALKNV